MSGDTPGNGKTSPFGNGSGEASGSDGGYKGGGPDMAGAPGKAKIDVFKEGAPQKRGTPDIQGYPEAGVKPEHVHVLHLERA